MIILSEPPPSVNSLYPDRGGRRRKSGRYTKWQVKAGNELMSQPHKKHEGRVRIQMVFGFATKHIRDVFNYVKAIEDLLVLYGVVQDDNTKFVRGGEVWLVEDTGLEPFVGVRIRILEHDIEEEDKFDEHY